MDLGKLVKIQITLVTLLVIVAVISQMSASADAYLIEDPEDLIPSEYYPETLAGENYLDKGQMLKRGCIKRNGGCDKRPNECCNSSSCRCNLWGTNCRCQRMGLLQKWGK